MIANGSVEPGTHQEVPEGRNKRPRIGLLTLFHTIRYLKPEQIAGQILLRWRRVTERPERFAQTVSYPKFPGLRWKQTFEALPPSGSSLTAESVISGRYQFWFGETHDVGYPPADWNAPGPTKLWRYNLHYHEWIWLLPYEEARRITLDWLERHPIGRNQVGWEPYPISLRLQNWCALFFGKWRERTLGDEEFRDRLWRGIVLQAEWLRGHLEWHLMGNHLLENAIALSIVGSAFEGSLARGWRDEGFQLLSEQLEEQMLDDGMHFELSPMYHARVIYALLLLQSADDEELSTIVKPYVQKGLHPLDLLRHPDGDFAMFGDSAPGIMPLPQNLLDWAARLGNESASHRRGVWELIDSGYFGYRDTEGNAFIGDLGPLGPDYIPGHMHADHGSFEVSVNGRRVIAEPGITTYEDCERRRFERSQEAHPLAMQMQRGQAEFWGAFRVGKRERYFSR